MASESEQRDRPSRSSEGAASRPLVLVLGGTAETGPTASALVAAGFSVLVSTATELQLSVPSSNFVRRRCGALDVDGMSELVRRESIRVIVDVTHPYALEVKAVAREAAARAGVPYFSYERPAALQDEKGVLLAASHEEAARLATSFGVPILLTVGSRNAAVYAREAARKGCILYARVLPTEESVKTCLKAGIPRERILTGRGPFTIEENCTDIRRCGAGVLVTKDSGEAGGVLEKLEAARRTNCLLVAVGRPHAGEQAHRSIEALVAAALKRF